MTWVYISVVFTSDGRAVPGARGCSPVLSIWVAKLWRRVWQPTFLSSPACACGSFHRLFAGRIRARDGASPGPSAGQERARAGTPTPAGLPRGLWVFPGQAPRGGTLLRIPLQGPGDGGLSTASICAATPSRRFSGQDGGSVLTALAARTRCRCWPKSTSWMRRRMHFQQAQALP